MARDDEAVHVARVLIGPPPPRLRDLRPGETGAALAAALGLTRCPTCGEFRGTCEDVEGAPCGVLCICDGISCRRCGVGRIRKPISDHFDESKGHLIHSAWYMGLVPCAACRSADDRATP